MRATVQHRQQSRLAPETVAVTARLMLRSERATDAIGDAAVAPSLSSPPSSTCGPCRLVSAACAALRDRRTPDLVTLQSTKCGWAMR